MLIFNFILSIIVILIMFGIISCVIKKLIYVFTKYNYESYYLLLPTFLILGVWSLCFLLWYFTITYFIKIDIVELIISFIIKEGKLENSFIITSLIYILFGIFLQGVAILTVNIDYNKLTGNTRFFFKKLLRIRPKRNGKLIIKNKPEKISFIEAIAISILSFLIIITSISLLFFVGYIISKNLI